MAPGAGPPRGLPAGAWCGQDSVVMADVAMTDAELDGLVAYWEAANYLTVGQIYLRDNPLLREPLRPSTSSPACSATGARHPASTSCTCT